MLETVAALLVLGMLGTALISGVSTISRSTDRIVTYSELENLARNQMELMFSLPYHAAPYTYPAVAVPAGYSITCEATEYEPGATYIELVTVTISIDGAERLVMSAIRAE